MIVIYLISFQNDNGDALCVERGFTVLRLLGLAMRFRTS